MRLRSALLLPLLLASALLAQQPTASTHIVALDGYVLSVRGDSLSTLQRFDTLGPSLKYGTADPVISPDSRHFAFTRDNAAFVAPLNSKHKPDEELVAQGKAGAKALLSVDIFLIGFSRDSKSLYYNVALGKDPCPDCPPHRMDQQQADYGFYRYDLATGKSLKVDIPGNTRIHPAPVGDRLFITRVGSYGDQFGMFNLASKDFTPFPRQCATALNCTIDASAQHAYCSRILQGKSQAVECDLRSGSFTPLTEPGTCPTEFDQPQRSSGGTHVSYLQSTENCSSKALTLWVDQKPVFKCEILTHYLWVGDQRLLVHCGGQIHLLSTDGKIVKSIAAPQSTAKADDED